ncbi:rhodanese-like domain-containing protein [Neisseria iguanae]|uniref:Rhodanese domain-containing protein n=1 Tax=Neisseria iguanae TaxID=90242 RepID=A0A2P7U1F1_9NEIS|nr:rhodanese family protein [Neisseria iguanae]PSJ80797.1 hypothetical protein C7N83_03995 [Neisseria iguanae]
MKIQALSAREVQQKLTAGAMLVDVRGVAEYAREHIDGTVNIPLDKLGANVLPAGLSAADTLVFYCQSGMRTAQNVAILEKAAHGKTAYILERGILGWKEGGFNTVVNRSRPIDLMRQVQIGAGLLALLGALGGWLVSPWFYLLCGMVGAGLLLAGVTGFCGMARLLMLMPWNQSLRQQAKSS